MGQYYLICNLDKREYLHPARFDEGLKAREWGSGRQVPVALSLLLIDGDGRGGGDFNVPEIAGRWAGDKIVVAGDYADEGRFCDSVTPSEDFCYKLAHVQDKDDEPIKTIQDVNIYTFAQRDFKDISKKVIDEWNIVYGESDERWTYRPPSTN
jgi:hypothetical protein